MGGNLSCAKTRPSRVQDNQFKHEPQGTSLAPLTFGTGAPVSSPPPFRRAKPAASLQYNLCSAVKEGYSCNIPSCMYNVHVPNCRSERTCLRFIIYRNRHNHRTINWIKQLGVTLVAMYYTVRRENKVTYCIVYKIHHKNDDSNKFEILLQQMIFVC